MNQIRRGANNERANMDKIRKDSNKEYIGSGNWGFILFGGRLDLGVGII
jgi:hypothetical protein